MKGEIKTRRTLGADGEWELSDVYVIDGVEVTLAEWREKFPEREGVPYMTAPGAYPIRSDAMACHPDQIPEIVERNRKKGIAVEYDKVGRPVLKSQAEKRALMRAEGFHDRNCYY